MIRKSLQTFIWNLIYDEYYFDFDFLFSSRLSIICLRSCSILSALQISFNASLTVSSISSWFVSKSLRKKSSSCENAKAIIWRILWKKYLSLSFHVCQYCIKGFTSSQKVLLLKLFDALFDLKPTNWSPFIHVCPWGRAWKQL